MGWSPGDEQVKEEARTQAALARKEVYKLTQILNKIKHDEKRTVLVTLSETLTNTLYQIDFQLNR